jgi:hypothetical protein
MNGYGLIKDDANSFSTQIRKFIIPAINRLCSTLPNVTFSTMFSSSVTEALQTAPTILCSDFVVSDIFFDSFAQKQVNFISYKYTLAKYVS